MAVCSKACANCSAAGFINEQCEGTDTGRAMALPPFSLANAITASTKVLSPAITTCPCAL